MRLLCKPNACPTYVRQYALVLSNELSRGLYPLTCTYIKAKFRPHNDTNTTHLLTL